MLITILVFNLYICSAYGQDIDRTPYLHWDSESGLPSNEVYHIIESRKGEIWIATDNGVAKYNGRKFTFFQKKEGLTDNVVFKLFEDEKGVIWCTTYNSEICKILPNDSIVSYQYNDTIDKYIPKEFSSNLLIISLVVSNDSLFIGYNKKGEIVITPEGNYQLSDQTSQEYRVKKIGKYSTQYSNPQSVDTVFLDNHLIIKSKLKKLVEKNIEYGYSCRLNNGKLVGTYANAAFIEKDSNLIDTLFFPEAIIYVASIDNLLWFGVSNNGAYAYNLEKNSWVCQYHLFQNRSISSVIMDKNRGFWFSTHENGIYYLPDLSYQSKVICGNSHNIYDVRALNDLIFIISSKQQVEAYDKNDLSLKQLIDKPFSGTRLCQFDDGYTQKKLSVHTGDSLLLKFDGSSSKMSHLSEKELIFREYVSENKSISVTTYEKITLENHLTGTTSSINGKFGTSKVFVFDNLVFTTNSVGCGLYKISEDSITFLGRFLSNEQVEHIKHYSFGIYCSSKSGTIYKYIPESNRFEPFLNTNNTNLSDFEIVKDQIWLATKDGLLKVKDSKITKFWEEPVKSVFASDTGVLFVTQKELVKFKDYERIDNSSVFIRSYSVNGLKKNKTSFSYSENNFEFNIGIRNPIPEKKYEIHAVLIGEDTIITLLDGTKISYPQLSPGTYQFYLKNLSNGSESEVLEFRIYPPIFERWWFLSIVIGVLLIIVLLIMRSIYRRREKKHFMQKQLTELQSKALRAQMNPHFIFNTMNVIQSLISSKRLDDSSDVLVKLSKLIRNALNYSRQEIINLEDEILFCQNYFNLENLRIENRMQLNVNLSPTINPKKIGIPPLTIQPILENAIVHGLIPKQGDGMIDIDIKDENDTVIIVVSDTGVGFTPSTREKGHQSYGIDLIAQRITLLDKRNSILIKKNEHETGTVVKITLYKQ
ncbi:sensor histidine kinase [Parvicella tangerina]|uniref:Signal transduction histidine kinase internal region domain-containing protein n=1 Tax=Parvicella tangerina TaxID=2829795 RepID=A0A916NF90_9FLAO|nr:histidine kinase [Parvicella tangerina]CAG5077225.1 hypothetical protein CRYO30217_00324 [Parvicella tangerina]